MSNWEPIVFLLLYIAVGLTLSAPYLLLAGSGWGWQMEYRIPTALFLPLFAFIWLVVGFRSGVIRFERWGEPIGLRSSRTSFWLLSIYMALPILLNGVAKLLNFIGYADIGGVIFEHRFAVLPAVLLVSIAALVVLAAAASALESVRERFDKTDA